MNGTVTISISDFKKMEEAQEKLNELLPSLEDVRADIDMILKESHVYGDMEKISKAYNEKNRKTIITLKPEGWRLIKRRS
jgi:hypothetical protein